jgi:hypothetical protein
MMIMDGKKEGIWKEAVIFIWRYHPEHLQKGLRNPRMNYFLTGIQIVRSSQKINFVTAEVTCSESCCGWW